MADPNLEFLVDACRQAGAAASAYAQPFEQVYRYFSGLSTDDIGVQIGLLSAGASVVGAGVFGAGRLMRYLGECCGKARALRPLYDADLIDERPWTLNADRLYEQHRHLLD